MARRGLNKLTALGVQRAKTTGYFSDGGNLYLRVSEYGTKSWLFCFCSPKIDHPCALKIDQGWIAGRH